MKDKSYLPYFTKFIDRGRDLRKAGVLSEVLLWKELQNKKFKGLIFKRQKNIGSFFADFYCHSKKVVIEIDGITHDFRKEQDEAKDAYFANLGIKVIRILDSDVRNNLDAIMNFLQNHEYFK